MIFKCSCGADSPEQDPERVALLAYLRGCNYVYYVCGDCSGHPEFGWVHPIHVARPRTYEVKSFDPDTRTD